MATEKFENNIRKALQEREITPSSGAWERLEQRLEQKKGATRSYFWRLSAAAAIAVVFFLLGRHFKAPMDAEVPQIVEESPEMPILEEKTTEPEVLQVAFSEVEEISETSAEAPAKNNFYESHVDGASGEDIVVASQDLPEAPVTTEEDVFTNDLVMDNIEAEEVTQNYVAEVSDGEIEALLLIATADLKATPAYNVSAENLLHEVEYELDQSFRQKVFDVVKESLLRAKTAVANRDF